MPEQTLAHIDESLVRILDELKTLRTWIRTERRRRRLSIAIVSVILFTGMVGLFWVSRVAERVEERHQQALVVIEEGRREALLEVCESRNQGRQSIRTALDLLALSVAGDMINEPDVRQRYDEFRAELEGSLPDLECDLVG